MMVLRTIPIHWPPLAVRFARWTIHGHPNVCQRCSCLPQNLIEVQWQSGRHGWLCRPCVDLLATYTKVNE